MADLKKLDDIVEQLGAQSKKLTSFSEIYAEIDKIKSDLKDTVNSFELGSQKLDQSSNDLEIKIKELNAKLSEIQGAIMQRVDSIDDSNKKNQKILQDKVKDQSAKLIEIQGSLMQRLDLIADAHKKFQRDLDSDLASKLSKHKSDIKVTVREEGKATAETIENKLNTTFLKELNNINKKNTLLILLGVAIVVMNVVLIQNLVN
jgi:chromosome segregation ATPase